MNVAALQRVHEQLASMTSEGKSLHRHSPLATYHSSQPGQITEGRLRFQRGLLDEFLAEGEEYVAKEGKAAVVVTAGPPGAGKSTHIEAMHLAEGWRDIDADQIKTKLLEAAVREGTFADLLAVTLADGHPIMMNELSSLVHNESVFLADRLIERCLERQENVVIQGTLSWAGLPPRYSQLLAQHDYSAVTLLDVEVEKSVALERAFARWSAGRIATIEGRSVGGGRFTPVEAITSIYEPSRSYSRCNQNAVDFFNAKEAEDFDDLRLIVCYGEGPDSQSEYRRIVGQYSTSIPGYLKNKDANPAVAGFPIALFDTEQGSWTRSVASPENPGAPSGP